MLIGVTSQWVSTCMSIDLLSGNTTAATSSWVDMPSMQEARKQSSSCALAGYVYVFCG